MGSPLDDAAAGPATGCCCNGCRETISRSTQGCSRGGGELAGRYSRHCLPPPTCSVREQLCPCCFCCRPPATPAAGRCCCCCCIRQIPSACAEVREQPLVPPRPPTCTTVRWCTAKPYVAAAATEEEAGAAGDSRGVAAAAAAVEVRMDARPPEAFGAAAAGVVALSAPAEIEGFDEPLPPADDDGADLDEAGEGRGSPKSSRHERRASSKTNTCCCCSCDGFRGPRVVDPDPDPDPDPLLLLPLFTSGGATGRGGDGMAECTSSSRARCPLLS